MGIRRNKCDESGGLSWGKCEGFEWFKTYVEWFYWGTFKGCFKLMWNSMNFPIKFVTKLKL